MEEEEVSGVEKKDVGFGVIPLAGVVLETPVVAREVVEVVGTCAILDVVGAGVALEIPVLARVAVEVVGNWAILDVVGEVEEEEEVGGGVVEAEAASTAACQVASNPGPVTLESEVKRTCKYPVDDVYMLLELTDEPDRRAICVGELQDDDVH